MSKELLLLLDTIVLGVFALIWSGDGANLLIKLVLAGLAVFGLLALAHV